VAGKLLERAGRALPEPPTSHAVLEGLWSVNDDDLGGLTYPLTFVRDQPTEPKACWFNLVIQGGAWLSPDNFARHCSPRRLNGQGLPRN
jgi:branched-chain amino acid transport system substrate-binding protein